MMELNRASRLNWNGAVVTLMSYELNGFKWNELFQDEEELIESLRQINVNVFTEHYKGVSYIKSFYFTLKRDRELTPNQLTQLKRLASEIYTYHWNDKNTNLHIREVK